MRRTTRIPWSTVAVSLFVILSVVAVGTVAAAGTAVADETNESDEQIAYEFEIETDGDTYAFGIPGPINTTLGEVIDDAALVDADGDNAVSVFEFDQEVNQWVPANLDESPDPLSAYIITTSDGGEDAVTVNMSIEFEQQEGDGIVPASYSVSEGYNFISAPLFAGSGDAFGLGAADISVVLDRYAEPESDEMLGSGAPFGVSLASNDDVVSPFKGYFVFAQEDGEIPSLVSGAQTQADANEALNVQPAPEGDLTFIDQATNSPTLDQEEWTSLGVVLEAESNVNSTVLLTYEEDGETVVAGAEYKTQEQLDGDGPGVYLTPDGYPGELTAHVIPTAQISDWYERGDVVSDDTLEAALASESADVYAADVVIDDQPITDEDTLTVTRANVLDGGANETEFVVTIHVVDEDGLISSPIGQSDEIVGKDGGFNIDIEDSDAVDEGDQIIAVIQQANESDDLTPLLNADGKNGFAEYHVSDGAIIRDEDQNDTSDPTTEIAHSSSFGSSTSDGERTSEILTIESKQQDAMVFGGDTNKSLEIRHPENNKSLELTPKDESDTLESRALELHIQDPTGNISQSPTVYAVTFSDDTEQKPIPVLVSGDMDLFTHSESVFSSFEVALLVDGSEVDVTDKRKIGVGYEGIVEVTKTDEEVIFTLNRETDVEEDWFVEFISNDPDVATEVQHNESTDQFEVTLDSDSVSPGSVFGQFQISESEDSPTSISNIVPSEPVLVDVDKIVDGDGDDSDRYETIELALNNATEDTVIAVKPGEYDEGDYLGVNTSNITLVSLEGQHDTKIQSAIDITGDNVTIDGFTIRPVDPEFGIFASADGATVRNNIITGSVDSDILVRATDEVTIKNNELRGVADFDGGIEGSGAINIQQAFPEEHLVQSVNDIPIENEDDVVDNLFETNWFDTLVIGDREYGTHDSPTGDAPAFDIATDTSTSSDEFTTSLITAYPTEADTLPFSPSSNQTFKLTNELTNESIEIIPENEDEIYDPHAIVFVTFDGEGEVRNNPYLDLGFYEGDEFYTEGVNATINGNESVLTRSGDTFIPISLSLYDSGQEVATVGEQLIGVGYEGYIEQNSSSEDIALSVNREEEVNEDWDTELTLYDEDYDTIVQKEVDNIPDRDEFTSVIDSSEIESGNYTVHISFYENLDDKYETEILTLFENGEITIDHSAENESGDTDE